MSTSYTEYLRQYPSSQLHPQSHGTGRPLTPQLLDDKSQAPPTNLPRTPAETDSVNIRDFRQLSQSPLADGNSCPSPPMSNASIPIKSEKYSFATHNVEHSLPSPTPSRPISTQQNDPSHPQYQDITPSISSVPPASVYSLAAETYDTGTTSIVLPPLQDKGASEEFENLEQIDDDDPRSFDLIPPGEAGRQTYSLETRSQQLFSREHLKVIFSDPSLLLRFTSFLGTYRQQSIPILIYYLDALKAIKAINYANAIAEALEPIDGYEFTFRTAKTTSNTSLEEKANQAFKILVEQDLPAYITHVYIQIVSLSITRRITGTLTRNLREASEGLAEVFCLTDPSRPDNPIVFASEEFYRTTQYGISYALGRNCRFLQGPQTNRLAVKRISDAIKQGRSHCETFLNYRRDGSPFMNLLMVAPLSDSRGKIRYFIGAQVDVSGIVKDCTELESLQKLVVEQRKKRMSQPLIVEPEEEKDEFQELSEMMNMTELETVQKHGGRMHREQLDDEDGQVIHSVKKSRVLVKERDPFPSGLYDLSNKSNGLLSGVYENYLLVRPYPSLRILFASPSLRVPGILQSPLMKKIGGSPQIQEELATALSEGRGVTAKVRWISRYDEVGYNRWIHCTPLVGSNGQIGVWMIVVVDDERRVRIRQAPPVKNSTGVIRGDTLVDEYTYIRTGGAVRKMTREEAILETRASRPNSRHSSSVRTSSPSSLKF
ncbi:MAG: hypothetical protein M1834_001681 [Cirrosporium novae-zelandiae]|nr:MAG: hypothetical protein M1834_001681 [Cirrosporium novae-zelandiae]